MRRYILLIAALVIALDRWTKVLVRERIPFYSGIDIIPGLLRFTHTTNPGAAFGMFSESTSPWRTAGLIAFTVAALIVIFALIWRLPRHWTMNAVALGLILGGAVGNLYDRVHYHEVIDFILFYHRTWQFPVFNIADSAITVGAALMFWELMFVRGSPAAARADV